MFAWDLNLTILCKLELAFDCEHPRLLCTTSLVQKKQYVGLHGHVSSTRVLDQTIRHTSSNHQATVKIGLTVEIMIYKNKRAIPISTSKDSR